jgi:phosphoenolpyruvate synthase/pyruvate phosphate dikinase
MSIKPLLVTGPQAPELAPEVGAKAANLRILSLHGFAVTRKLFIPPAAYHAFVHHADLAQRIESLPKSLRDGMLVHRAIIAREYGIPCVTGVDEATARIKDGQTLLVDGFRGEVVLDPLA